MCLDVIDKVPVVTEGEGYKLFSVSRDHHLYNWNSERFRVRGVSKWITDKQSGMVHFGGYEKGFHLFMSEGDAWKYTKGCRPLHRGFRHVVRRVSFRRVVVTGKQEPVHFTRPKVVAVVAKEIYIHPLREAQ